MNNAFLRNIHNHFRRNETAIHELTYLFWECTLRCNLNCIHCGSDCKKESRVEDMPLEDFLAAIEPFRPNGKSKVPINIVLTGGEPLLRKDLARCGKEFRKRGFRWGIVTNGMGYTPERHNELLNAGMGALTLSVDGLKDSHNWMRNSSKSFDRVQEALQLITSSSRLNSDVVTCVNQRNIKELEAIKTFLIKNKVKAWRLFTIAPIGRAKNYDELFLNPGQLTYLMDFIVNTRKEKMIDAKYSCEAYVGPYEKKVRDTYFFCRAGINIASILADGSIAACPNIDKSFIQGNIYKDSFVDIWNNRYTEMRNREWSKTGKCADCKEFKHCLGNGLHWWDADREEVLVCHNSIISKK
ncbi:MAG: TIGR04133 family radical SAM/SPASM protein [Bacteroidales bacterium]|nr:TIGR04133 family radical SAM/SPASM protein [Bacteroidales bacterium]